MFRRILTIATSTTGELLRQPVLGLLVTVTAAMICMSPALSMFSMSDDYKLMTDMNLATMLLAGVLAAVFCSHAAVAREREDKNVLAVLTKPVTPVEFMLGKVGGLNFALAVFSLLVGTVVVLMVRFKSRDTGTFATDWAVAAGLAGVTLAACIVGGAANYFFDRNFVSSALVTAAVLTPPLFLLMCFVNGRFEVKPFGSTVDTETLKAVILVGCGILTMGAVSALFSTFLGLGGTAAAAGGVFFLGMISAYLFLGSPYTAAKAVYAVIPDMQVFFLSDALIAGKHIPTGYLTGTIAYTVFYQGALAAAAALVVANREYS